VNSGELLRARFAFGLLGLVPVFLAGWLGYVQVAEAGELAFANGAALRLVPATADRQVKKSEVLPAPRGTIVDRHGSLLALDCETYEVRANITVPRAARKSCEAFRAWLRKFLDDITLALVAEPDLPDRGHARALHAERLGKLIAAAFRTGELPVGASLPKDHPVRGDVLIDGDVDSLAVLQSLRGLADSRDYATVGFHFLRSHRREYPDRDLTHGLVGHLKTEWQPAAGGGKALHTVGVSGLEALGVLAPEPAAARPFLRDGKGRPYFVASAAEQPTAAVLQSTIDIELQRIAVRELAAQAAAGAREGKITVPKWGALVLVEIDSGDVLAAASWHRETKHAEASPFTPNQSLFEPGSIVKPLVLAYAHEVGAFDWDQVFDCAPGSAEYRERIGQLGRRKPVRDDHACGELSAHGIITNSSNIGAAYVGLLLERPQWADYVRYFGFDQPLGLDLPWEGRARPNGKSFDPQVPLRSFRANTAISFSFGYELMVTPFHMARAYLRLFRGGEAQLRLCRGVRVDGSWHGAPVSGEQGARFRDEVVGAAQAAMIDVVSADPKATGTYLHARMLKDLGIDLHGVVGGKTGTAVVSIGQRDGSRNASFVGFLPAERPRWLAMCVLQKDDRASFYGGSYAAPPVVRLLLQCQQLEQRRQLRQETAGAADGQIRGAQATPGDSGWSPGASETNAVGR
jgi:cell division protein FtsI/penicillin-binding protein 2